VKPCASVKDQFKKGDEVRKKSGGPEMTIVKIDVFTPGGEEQAFCEWFVDEHLKRETFNLFSLDKVEPSRMYQESFKKGDVTRLRSGGPKMTIENIDVFTPGGEEQAFCEWSLKGQPKRETFNLSSLGGMTYEEMLDATAKEPPKGQEG
jgi:uncharacterized protein YodC (DUF2158 family)